MAASTSKVKVSANSALKTPQFWLLWIVLCLNVTAGIGILEKAAPMIQDFFEGTSTPVAAAAATGFVSLLSLANMLGRFVWSALSDRTGRKNIYRLYLGAGALAYLVLLFAGSSSVALFVVVAMLVLSFYGAGFATIPAYLKDLFGVYEVGAIHGRLLTAWSVAGVLGPLIVDALADAGESAGKSGSDLYTTSFLLMTAFLVIGFVANELIKPVHPKYHVVEDGDSSAASGDAAATGAEADSGAKAGSAKTTADSDAKAGSAKAGAEADTGDSGAKADSAKSDAKADTSGSSAKADSAEPGETAGSAGTAKVAVGAEPATGESTSDDSAAEPTGGAEADATSDKQS